MASKAKMIEEHGPCCYICGIETVEYEHAEGEQLPPHALTIDHVVPIAKGGTSHPLNLRVCCHSCNNKKGDMCMLTLLQKKWELGILGI